MSAGTVVLRLHITSTCHVHQNVKYDRTLTAPVDVRAACQTLVGAEAPQTQEASRSQPAPLEVALWSGNEHLPFHTAAQPQAEYSHGPAEAMWVVSPDLGWYSDVVPLGKYV